MHVNVELREESMSRSFAASPIEPPFASMSIVWPRTFASPVFFASRIEPLTVRSETLPVVRSAAVPCVQMLCTGMAPVSSSR